VIAYSGRRETDAGRTARSDGDDSCGGDSGRDLGRVYGRRHHQAVDSSPALQARLDKAITDGFIARSGRSAITIARHWWPTLSTAFLRRRGQHLYDCGRERSYVSGRRVSVARRGSKAASQRQSVPEPRGRPLTSGRRQRAARTRSTSSAGALAATTGPWPADRCAPPARPEPVEGSTNGVI
jgi:hypothetical protein